MSVFDKYRKAAAKRPLPAALEECEAALIKERDLLYHKVFTSQITEKEANRRLLYLLKPFFMVSDIQAFFSGECIPQQAEQLKALAQQMSEAINKVQTDADLMEQLLRYMKAYFVGLPTYEEPTRSDAKPQQTLFH